ncbi:hypothetical protein BJ508DRAFT_335297, partial [Ascobolus immersus RN42]
MSANQHIPLASHGASPQPSSSASVADDDVQMDILAHEQEDFPPLASQRKRGRPELDSSSDSEAPSNGVTRKQRPQPTGLLTSKHANVPDNYAPGTTSSLALGSQPSAPVTQPEP